MIDPNHFANADRQFDENQFAHTVIRLEVDGSWWELVPVPESNAIADFSPLPETLHVISGCNPGYRETDEVNAQRHIYIRRRLRESGVHPMAAIGISPDGAWVEPSWAVTGLTREAVCSLGLEFGQVAVFEIQGGVVRIVRCSDSAVMSSRGLRFSPA